MSVPSKIQGDQVFYGQVTFSGTVVLPDESIGNDELDPADPIDPNKLGHIHVQRYGQPNTAATTETRVVHVVVGVSGTILDVVAGLIAACTGDATVTVDLQKSTGGGAFATVLTGAISLGSGDAAIVPKDGVLVGASADVAAGDVLRVVITATAGTGALGTGLFCQVRVQEDAE